MSVGVYIDLENISCGNPEQLREIAFAYGDVRVFRGFADVVNSTASKKFLQCYNQLGIDIVHCQRTPNDKNVTDMTLAIECVSDCMRLNLTHVILVTSDSDFIPLIRMLKNYGIVVIGIINPDSTHPGLTNFFNSVHELNIVGFESDKKSLSECDFFHDVVKFMGPNRWVNGSHIGLFLKKNWSGDKKSIQNPVKRLIKTGFFEYSKNHLMIRNDKYLKLLELQEVSDNYESLSDEVKLPPIVNNITYKGLLEIDYPDLFDGLDEGNIFSEGFISLCENLFVIYGCREGWISTHVLFMGLNRYFRHKIGEDFSISENIASMGFDKFKYLVSYLGWFEEKKSGSRIMIRLKNERQKLISFGTH